MNDINSGMLVYVILALLAVVLIVSIIKKAVKLVIFIIVIILGFSAYNILVKGVSPIEEVNGYAVNFNYSKAIAKDSVKIKTSIDNIKAAMGAKTIDANVIGEIKSENENLHKYYEEVSALKHTRKLDSFHEKYINYLKSIVDACDEASNLAKSSQGKSISLLRVVSDKINSSLNQLLELGKK